MNAILVSNYTTATKTSESKQSGTIWYMLKKDNTSFLHRGSLLRLTHIVPFKLLQIQCDCMEALHVCGSHIHMVWLHLQAILLLPLYAIEESSYVAAIN